MSTRSHLLRFAAFPTVAVVAMAVSALPAVAKSSPEVLLDGLSSPKGLVVVDGGNPVVSQGAFGPPGPVLAYQLRGRDHGTTVDITGPLGLTDLAVDPEGVGWGIGGDRVLYRQGENGEPEPIFDIAAYQKTDPDPYNTNGPIRESNPYAVTALPSGDVLVADAAANDIIRVTPSGDAWTVARFTPEIVSTDHIPASEGLPPQMPAEAVPTTMSIGPGGDILVGQLIGFPFTPGASHVWRLDPNAQGAVCSSTAPNARCSVYRSGFTGIQDIAYDPRNRALYVYELAAEGVLAFEEGFATGEFPPAVLLKVMGGKRTELAAGQLSEPGGVAVGRPAGQVLVTDGMFSSGRLLRVVR